MSALAGVDGNFPIFSPDGLHLASGSGTLSIFDVTPATGAITHQRLLPGYYPNWLTTTRFVFSNGGNGSTGRLRVSDAPYAAAADLLSTPLPMSQLGAGGGVFVSTLLAAGGPQTTVGTAAGITTTLSGRKDPAVDTNGRYILNATNGDAVYVSGIGRVSNEIGIFTPRIATGGACWSLLPGYVTHGWKGGGIETLALTAPEFNPLVVDTPAGPWILSLTETGAAPGIYIHPWGNSNTVLLQAGTGPNTMNYPTAVYHAGAGGFLFAWYRPQGAVLTTGFQAVNVLDPLYAIGSGTVVGPGPSGTTPTAPATPPTTKQLEAAKLAGARAAKRQYPHVSDITDPHAQKSVRLLWDRVFEIGEQLNGTRDSALKTQTAGVSSDLTSFKGTTATTITQLQATTTGTPLPVFGFPGGASSSQGPGGGSGGGGGGGGGGGQSGGCAGVTGTGHIPAGELTFDRAQQIICGTANEWGGLTQAVATLDERNANAVELIRRMIWHLALGAFTAGRQVNPSAAVSKDKLAVVILGETRAFDVFRSFDTYTEQMVVQMNEVFPANLQADAGISD
jgi:hypothetical protein